MSWRKRMASPIYTAMAYYARPYNQLLVKILFNWSLHGQSTTCMNFLTFVQRWSYNWRGRSLTTRCYHRLLLYSCPPEMYQCARTGLTQAQAMAINGSNGAYTDVSRSIFCATRLNGFYTVLWARGHLPRTRWRQAQNAVIQGNIAV